MPPVCAMLNPMRIGFSAAWTRMAGAAMVAEAATAVLAKVLLVITRIVVSLELIPSGPLQRQRTLLIELRRPSTSLGQSKLFFLPFLTYATLSPMWFLPCTALS